MILFKSDIKQDSARKLGLAEFYVLTMYVSISTKSIYSVHRTYVCMGDHIVCISIRRGLLDMTVPVEE